MPDPIAMAMEREGVDGARAAAVRTRIDAFPDLSAALAAWATGGPIDPELQSMGYTYRRLTDDYRFGALRALDLLAQVRVDPAAVNFLTRRVDRVNPAPEPSP